PTPVKPPPMTMMSVSPDSVAERRSRSRWAALRAEPPEGPGASAAEVVEYIPILSGTKSYQFAIAAQCCQDHSVVSRGRPYAGASREAREHARRERIIAAGIELFGTDGYRTATVGAVCETAGLNKRYFYESFATLEDLLCEVYQRVVADLRAAVLASDGNTAPEVLRGFIAAFLDWAQANPVEAKVHLFEVLGVSARVDELYRSYARSIGEELVDRLTAVSSGPALTAVSSGPALTAGNRRILGDVLVGAGVQIVVDWVISGYEPPRPWAGPWRPGWRHSGSGKGPEGPAPDPSAGSVDFGWGSLGSVRGSFGLTRARVGSSPASQRSGRPCRSARGVLA